MASDIKELINAMKASGESVVQHEDVVAALTSIDSRIVQQTVFTARMADTLDAQMKFFKDHLSDLGRDDRLAPKDTTKPTTGGGDGDGPSAAFLAGQNATNSIIGLPSLIAGNLIATVGAFTAALAGLRGWEAKGIEKLKGGLSALSDTVVNGAKSMRNSILVKYFGFVEEGTTVRDAKTGRFAKAMPMSDQIAKAVEDMKTKALRMFGLGVDGKPIAIQGEDGKFMKNTKGAFWSRATKAVEDLLSPVIKMADGVRDFFAGIGKPIADFMKNVGSKAGGFLGVVGKILKPIGFIFSAWDGITAYMDSDKDGHIARLGDGVGAFIGDFIGAPFDLLKSGISWILKKFFNVETDENGNAKPGQGLAGWAVTKLNSFSFEETIGNIVSGLFGMVQQAVDWVGLLFTDPKEALTKLWTGLVGEGGLVDMLFKPVNKAIDWVTKKFGWRDEDAPEFDLLKSIKESLYKASGFIQIKFAEVVEFFKSVPSRIMDAAEEFWTNLKADIQIGLIDLADWFAALPAKLLAMIMNSIGAIQFTVPDWVPGIGGKSVRLIDQEDVDAANAAANAAPPGSQARIDAINAERDTALQAIEDRRTAAEAVRLRQLLAVQDDIRRQTAANVASVTNNGGNTTNNNQTTIINNQGAGSSLDSALPK